MKRKIKKPLGLLMLTTTSLFSGCDILKQFEDRDLFGKQETLVFDSIADYDILSNQEKVQLPKGKNNGVASNIDNQDDNLAPGSFKIAWYAGGQALKGEEGETALGDIKGSISTFNTEKPVVGLKGQGVVSSSSASLGGLDAQNSGPAITEVQYGSSDVVDLSYNSITDTVISGQSTNKITEEHYDSNAPIVDIVEDSYRPISGLSGQNSVTTVIEESEIVGIDSKDLVEINPNDNRNKVKEYFNNLKNRLISIGKVNASANIERVIHSVNKIAGATGDNIGIGEIANSTRNNSSAISDRQSVQDIIEGIKEIVKIAQNSGISIKTGQYYGSIVDANVSSAVATLNGGDGGAGKESSEKLANEVSNVDEWAILDKINNATIYSSTEYYMDRKDGNGTSYNAGELITGYISKKEGVSAKTNADLAAAVALKAMSKDGKFAGYKGTDSGNYAHKVKEAAAGAVNKVLSALHKIIADITKKELGKN